MHIYYIEYEKQEGGTTIEAFKSRTAARKRVSELSKIYKTRKKEWQEWIITRKNRPVERPIDPPEVEQVSFDMNSDGLLSAFVYLTNRGK